MLRNIIANYIGRFWNAISNFIFIPLYISILGIDNYSIISFAIIIASIMVILDSGLTATLSRTLSRNDITYLEKKETFITLQTIYYIIVGLVILCLIFSAEYIVNSWIQQTAVEKQKIIKYLKIISIDIGFQLLFKFYIGGLLGLEKQVIANLFQISWSLFKNGFVVLIILFTKDLYLFFLWQAFITTLFAILLKIYLNKQFKINLSNFFNIKITISILKKTWKFTIGMLLISLIASLNTQLDRIFISKLLPLETLGYYTLAFALSMMLFVIINPISIALLPKFTDLISTGKINDTRKLFYLFFTTLSSLIIILAVHLFKYSNEILWLWTNNIEIANRSSVFLNIIIFGVTGLSLQILPFNIAIANGYTKINAIIGIMSLIITLPGYWLCTKLYGATGAASVYSLVQGIISIFYLNIINRKFIYLSNLKLFFYPIILPLLFSFVSSYFFKTIFYNSSFTKVQLIIFIFFSILFSLILVLILLHKIDVLPNLIKKLKSNRV